MNLADLPSLSRLDRELGLRGRFYDFVRMAWSHVIPYPYVDSWHVPVICDVLEAVQAGELRKVVINIPPGCSKSTLVSVFWPVWSWIRDPRLGFLTTSHGASLVLRDAGASLRLIQSEWFRERWGDVVGCRPDAGVSNYRNAQAGWRFATTTGGQGPGMHPDRKIIDDPTKPKDLSPQALEHTENYWRHTLSTRARDPMTVATVLIMQRLAVNDLAGIFERDGGWHFVVLPMRFEPGRAYAKDPRTKPGELLCPSRFPESAVAEREKELGSRAAAAQLQQRPVPEGGAIVKRAWIKWYDPTPNRQFPDLPRAPLRFSQKIQTWDLTFKDTKGSHFVAGQLWAVAGPDYYFIDGILERLDFVGSCEAILAMCTANPGCGVLIEDKANGPAVISMLKSKISGIVSVEPEGGKEARLNAVSPLFEAGNVWLPKGHPIAEILADSLAAFPAGAQDDDVDACTQVLTHLHSGVVDYTAAMKALRGGLF